MQLGIMHGISRFVTKKKAIRTRLPEKTIGGKGPLPHGQRDRAVAPGFLDASQQLSKPFVREPGVLSPLKNKRAESQSVAVLTAVQDLFGGKPVTFSLRITGPYAAVAAVLPADVGNFNKSANINSIAEMLLSSGSGTTEQLLTHDVRLIVRKRLRNLAAYGRIRRILKSGLGQKGSLHLRSLRRNGTGKGRGSTRIYEGGKH